MKINQFAYILHSGRAGRDFRGKQNIWSLIRRVCHRLKGTLKIKEGAAYLKSKKEKAEAFMQAENCPKNRFSYFTNLHNN